MTETKDKEIKSSDPLADQKDDDGNLIDPPTLPEYERRLADAHLRADDDDIADITKEYNREREKRAKVLAKREADR